MGPSMEPAGIRVSTLRFHFPRESVVGENKFHTFLMFDVSKHNSQFFVKESSKEDHIFPNLDFKISKFKILSFPILHISSQKSLVL